MTGPASKAPGGKLPVRHVHKRKRVYNFLLPCP